jgi:hypothetical protein
MIHANFGSFGRIDSYRLRFNGAEPNAATLPACHRNSNARLGRGLGGVFWQIELMTWPAQAIGVSELGAVESSEPQIETRTHSSQGDPANAWLCAWCLNHVASEKDRFSYEGESEFSFKNPEGIRFNIFTFARTTGCREVGVPTLEHTWFPGHAWSYCVCDGCRMLLGWYYGGSSEFAGLIRDRIVRASLVMS